MPKNTLRFPQQPSEGTPFYINAEGIRVPLLWTLKRLEDRQSEVHTPPRSEGSLGNPTHLSLEGTRVEGSTSLEDLVETTRNIPYQDDGTAA